jgi:hypothetical protein
MGRATTAYTPQDREWERTGADRSLQERMGAHRSLKERMGAHRSLQEGMGAHCIRWEQIKLERRVGGRRRSGGSE